MRGIANRVDCGKQFRFLAESIECYRRRHEIIAVHGKIFTGHEVIAERAIPRSRIAFLHDLCGLFIGGSVNVDRPRDPDIDTNLFERAALNGGDHLGCRLLPLAATGVSIVLGSVKADEERVIGIDQMMTRTVIIGDEDVAAIAKGLAPCRAIATVGIQFKTSAGEELAVIGCKYFGFHHFEARPEISHFILLSVPQLARIRLFIDHAPSCHAAGLPNRGVQGSSRIQRRERIVSNQAIVMRGMLSPGVPVTGKRGA
ncbi:hypothetical protein GR212_15600 [Rhizobium lusitanum]|uniref:Uncharacterized protein n=1 Tax=Rhizobium lusitanum TaxID=293958 RepID=A0A6L9U501_9HYPH|nr:hypothetical protein [Rhizobium lusitanum]